MVAIASIPDDTRAQCAISCARARSDIFGPGHHVAQMSSQRKCAPIAVVPSPSSIRSWRPMHDDIADGEALLRSAAGSQGAPSLRRTRTPASEARSIAWLQACPAQRLRSYVDGAIPPRAVSVLGVGAAE